MNRDVFVVNAAQDGAVAEIIVKFLEERGVQGWLRQRDFADSAENDEAYAKALSTARIFVVVFSRAANESRQCQAEAARALESGKLIIPFRVSSDPASGSMELLLKRRYCVEALQPPLDPRLEELFRVVKPFANHRAGAKPEASISRTMPGRAAILGPGKANISREHTGPFQTALNLPRVIQLRAPAQVGVVVANQGGQLLESVQIELSGLGIQPISMSLSDLSPGTQATLFLEIVPKLEATKLVRIVITGYDRSTKFCYSGSHAIRVSSSGDETIPILRREDGPSPLELTEVTRATMSFQAREEDAVPTLTLEDEFEMVDLSLEFAHSLDAESVSNTRNSAQIPFAFHGQKEAGQLLVLERMDHPSPLPYQEIRISARPSFSFGRSREEADYVLWFWPRNEMHDPKTLRISKKQCELSRGATRINLRSATTSNATTLDGVELTGVGIDLPRRGLLNLAGDYTLELQHQLPAAAGEVEISNLGQWAGTPAESTGPKGAVKFKALTPHVLPQQAVWLLSEATFGSSEGNGVVFRLPEIAETQGRFHHQHGGFWLENCVGNNQVTIDGHSLKPGTIAPLVTGKIIKIGGVRFFPRIS